MPASRRASIMPEDSVPAQRVTDPNATRPMQPAASTATPLPIQKATLATPLPMNRPALPPTAPTPNDDQD
jgi:hypothetical protein